MQIFVSSLQRFICFPFGHLGINTIINLQEHGEHAYCGLGNTSEGYSYSTKPLTQAGISMLVKINRQIHPNLTTNIDAAKTSTFLAGQILAYRPCPQLQPW